MTLVQGALLIGSLLGIAPVGDVSSDVRRIFADDHYYFCASDTDYQPGDRDLRWCELAEAEQFRGCPGYRRVCAAAPPPIELPVGETADQAERASERSESKPEREQPREVELPDMGPLAKILIWLLLIGAGVAVVVAIARTLLSGRGREQDEAPPPPDPGTSLVAARAELLRIIETDVRRLLERAERAAARGDHGAAITDVHAALLRKLEGERLISVDRWKTNGDFIQALRDKPSLRDELREIVREVEQVQFGGAQADATRYASVRGKVLAIVSRASLAVLLTIGLACDGTANVPGTGPSGQRAIAELLDDHEIDTSWRVAPFEQLEQTHAALALLDGVAPSDEDWGRLLAWVEDGNVLLVASGGELPSRLGRYVAGSDSETALLHPGSLEAFTGLMCAAPPGRTLDPPLRGEVLLARPTENSWDTPDPYVVRVALGEGKVIVFAESDMLTNAALLVPDNGAFLIDVLRSAEVDALELVDTSSGDGADDPFDSMRKAKLGPLFLQVLLFLALLYAAIGIPFARLKDPPERRRRAFVEHVRTLGQRYAQARAARYVAALYCGWALDRLRARLQPGSARGLVELAEAIARRTGHPQTEIMQILVEAHSLREEQVDNRGGPAELALMRQLAALLEQTR